MSRRPDEGEKSTVKKTLQKLPESVNNIIGLFGGIGGAVALNKFVPGPLSGVKIFLLLITVAIIFPITQFIFSEWIQQVIRNLREVKKYDKNMLAEWDSSLLKKYNPEAIRAYEPETLEKHTNSGLESYDPEVLNEISPTTMKTLQELGIKGCYPETSGAGYSPSGCTEKVNTRFWFRGVAGSHWVDVDSTKTQLEQLLDNGLTQNSDEVRFLILDPREEAFDNLNATPIDNVGKHYKEYEKLANNYDITIGLYDHLPQFRLTFINKNELVVSHYGNNNSAMEDPCFRIDNGADDTLYHPFEKIFERTWEDSVDIENQNIDYESLE